MRKNRSSYHYTPKLLNRVQHKEIEWKFSTPKFLNSHSLSSYFMGIGWISLHALHFASFFCVWGEGNGVKFDYCWVLMASNQCVDIDIYIARLRFWLLNCFEGNIVFYQLLSYHEHPRWLGLLMSYDYVVWYDVIRIYVLIGTVAWSGMRFFFNLRKLTLNMRKLTFFSVIWTCLMTT